MPIRCCCSCCCCGGWIADVTPWYRSDAACSSAALSLVCNGRRERLPISWRRYTGTSTCNEMFVVKLPNVDGVIYSSLSTACSMHGPKKARPRRVIAHVRKTTEPICTIFGPVHMSWILNTSVNYVFINFIAQRDATSHCKRQPNGFSLRNKQKGLLAYFPVACFRCSQCLMMFSLTASLMPGVVLI